METTIDLPEELLLRAEAEAARSGRGLREVVVEGILRVLDNPDPAEPARSATLHGRLGDYCGIVRSGMSDLSTNSKHMEGFGED